MESRHKVETVFDLWVQDALRERYGPALREPLPEMLRRVLDEADPQPVPVAPATT